MLNVCVCLTLGDITDAVFEIGSSTAPAHVLQTERLIRPQHDDLNGAGLEQSDLIFCRQVPETHDRLETSSDRGIIGFMQNAEKAHKSPKCAS